MRIQDEDDDGIGVDLSPLIDCVFLLLIFFLVTTMMKKLEKQIPVTLPESTSSLSAQPVPEQIIIGMDESGNYYRQNGRDRLGVPVYQQIEQLTDYLKEIATEHTTAQALRLDADPDTEFQLVIDALDICQIEGFQNTGVRILTPGEGSPASLRN